MNLNQVHVASYSPVQGCWHVESLAEHVRSNAKCLGRGVLRHTAYCAIALTESRDEAHAVIGRIKALLKEVEEEGHED